MRIIVLRRIVCCLLFFASGHFLLAQTSGVYESARDVEITRARVEEILNRLDEGNFHFSEETAGFDFMIESGFFSPFDYRIYGGPLSEKKPRTIIRMESGRGDVDVFASIFYRESLLAESPFLLSPDDPAFRPLAPKSHIPAQGANLIAPSLGVLEASRNSPRLSGKETLWQFLGYLALDAVIYRAAGSRWFQTGFRPGENQNNIVAGLLAIRLYGAFRNANLVRGHNRIAILGYTFALE